MSAKLDLKVLPGRFAVCRLDPQHPLPPLGSGQFLAITKTAAELSLVVAQEAVAPGWLAELGWRGFQVAGPLDFSLTGILAALTTPLAEAEIPIFAVSTYDTDYLFVKEAVFPRAQRVLQRAGHRFIS